MAPGKKVRTKNSVDVKNVKCSSVGGCRSLWGKTALLLRNLCKWMSFAERLQLYSKMEKNAFAYLCTWTIAHHSMQKLLQNTQTVHASGLQGWETLIFQNGHIWLVHCSCHCTHLVTFTVIRCRQLFVCLDPSPTGYSWAPQCWRGGDWWWRLRVRPWEEGLCEGRTVDSRGRRHAPRGW